jgi:hypothetical protein
MTELGVLDVNTEVSWFHVSITDASSQTDLTYCRQEIWKMAYTSDQPHC